MIHKLKEYSQQSDFEMIKGDASILKYGQN